MRKRISLKTRRPGTSPESFREHYEQRHVPLGLSYVDRFQWLRYVRNYVVDVDGEPVGFDAYTEFWVPDDADDEALARFVASPEFQALHEDDHRFLDVGARFSGEVVEVPLALGGLGAATEEDAREGAGGGVVKSALVWRSQGGSGGRPAKAAGGSAGPSSRDEAASLARRVVAPAGDRLLDATLEQVLDPPPTAPFDTLLTLWLPAAASSELDLAVLAEVTGSLLTVDPVETPADQLYRGGAAGADAALGSGPHSERTPT